MKRFLAIILCVVVLVCTTSIVAFAEGESPDAVAPDTSVTETVPEDEKPITETIVDYVKEHLEEISVIVSLIAAAIYKKIKDGRLGATLGTLNNNAITIAENSATTIKKALAEVEDISNVVNGYKDEIASLLAEIRKSAEEKKSLEDTLSHVETFLKTAKLATLELSNEVAELLVLANIPNSKKEELYARHTQAVHELEAVEEVMSNVGKEV